MMEMQQQKIRHKYLLNAVIP